MNKRTNGRYRCGVVVLCGLAGVSCVAVMLNRVGHWLIVADELRNAEAIVVLSGHLPFRAMEAASIYRQGWAPEVWITLVLGPDSDGALEKLGIHVSGEEIYNREVLQRLGVPRNKVRVLKDRVRNTVGEIRLIADELEEIGGDRVIIVTSKFHSRRVRATWNSIVGKSTRAIVRYAADDPFKPDGWWRHSGDALAVTREMFGIINLWAGLPVRAERQ